MQNTESSQLRTFEIRRCLGRGGFGEVYLATMISPGGLRNEIAVKVLRRDVDASGEAMRRLRDEGRLLAALKHPAILRIYDLAMLDGRVALVTEYVDGEDLHSCIGPRRGLPPRPIVEIIGTVAEALHAAYHGVPSGQDTALHMIHRDIKPSNIRLGRHGEVKLLDFGIAYSEDAQRESITLENSTIGSISYMAPERFTRMPATPASDIYGLGLTLYEGLVGERLYPDAVPVDMFQRAAQKQAHDRHVQAAFVSLPKGLPPDLWRLLKEMLHHSPTERPTAKEVAERCEALVEPMGGISLKRWCRERAWAEPEPVKGSFDGRVLDETPFPGGITEARELNDRRPDHTFNMKLLRTSEPAAERERRESEDRDAPTRWNRALSQVLMAALAVIGLLLLLILAISPLFKQVIAPAPMPVQPVPVAAPAAAPEEPTPPSEVERGPRAKGELVVRGDANVELRSMYGTYPPGEVPIGMYRIYADFGQGTFTAQGRVEVERNQTVTVNCDRVQYKCQVEGAGGDDVPDEEELP